MNDQAQNLRKRVKLTSKTNRNTRVIAVTSGKGGVGKSNISINFALGLAAEGKKVLLFDLDLGMANIDILLGKSMRFHAVHVMEGHKSIWEVMEEGPLGLKLIAGGSGLLEVFKLTTDRRARFTKQLSQLDGHFDFIIFDMGAGASSDSMQFILAANEVFIVTTSEPTSITDAYAMLKYVCGRDPDLPVSIIVNRTDSFKEGRQTADSLCRTSRRFLSKEVRYLGSVPYDKHVLQAVKQQNPFYDAQPNSPASRSITKCVNVYLGKDIWKDSSSFQTFVRKITSLIKGS